MLEPPYVLQRVSVPFVDYERRQTIFQCEESDMYTSFEYRFLDLTCGNSLN